MFFCNVCFALSNSHSINLAVLSCLHIVCNYCADQTGSYTKCPFSNKTRRFLVFNPINFIDIDVSKTIEKVGWFYKLQDKIINNRCHHFIRIKASNKIGIENLRSMVIRNYLEGRERNVVNAVAANELQCESDFSEDSFMDRILSLEIEYAEKESSTDISTVILENIDVIDLSVSSDEDYCYPSCNSEEQSSTNITQDQQLLESSNAEKGADQSLKPHDLSVKSDTLAENPLTKSSLNLYGDSDKNEQPERSSINTNKSDDSKLDHDRDKLIQSLRFSLHQNPELQQDRSKSLNANYKKVSSTELSKQIYHAQQIPSSNVNANKNSHKSDNVTLGKDSLTKSSSNGNSDKNKQPVRSSTNKFDDRSLNRNRDKLIQPTKFSSHQNHELQQDRSKSLDANYKRVSPTESGKQIPSSNVNANKNAHKSDNVNIDKYISQRSVQSSLNLNKSIDNSLYVHYNAEESMRSSRLTSYIDSSLKRSHDHPSRSQSLNVTKYDNKPLNQNTKQPVKSTDYNKNDKRSTSANPSSRFGPNNDKVTVSPTESGKQILLDRYHVQKIPSSNVNASANPSSRFGPNNDKVTLSPTESGKQILLDRYHVQKIPSSNVNATKNTEKSDNVTLGKNPLTKSSLNLYGNSDKNEQPVRSSINTNKFKDVHQSRSTNVNANTLGKNPLTKSSLNLYGNSDKNEQPVRSSINTNKFKDVHQSRSTNVNANTLGKNPLTKSSPNVYGNFDKNDQPVQSSINVNKSNDVLQSRSTNVNANTLGKNPLTKSSPNVYGNSDKSEQPVRSSINTNKSNYVLQSRLSSVNANTPGKNPFTKSSTNLYGNSDKNEQPVPSSIIINKSNDVHQSRSTNVNSNTLDKYPLTKSSSNLYGKSVKNEQPVRSSINTNKSNDVQQSRSSNINANTLGKYPLTKLSSNLHGNSDKNEQRVRSSININKSNDVHQSLSSNVNTITQQDRSKSLDSNCKRVSPMESHNQILLDQYHPQKIALSMSNAIKSAKQSAVPHDVHQSRSSNVKCSTLGKDPLTKSSSNGNSDENKQPVRSNIITNKSNDGSLNYNRDKLIQSSRFSSHQNLELKQDRPESLNANYAQQIPSSNVNANKNAHKSDNVNTDKHIYQRSVQSSLNVDKSIDNSLYVHYNAEDSMRSSRLSSYIDSSLKRSHESGNQILPDRYHAQKIASSNVNAIKNTHKSDNVTLGKNQLTKSSSNANSDKNKQPVQSSIKTNKFDDRSLNHNRAKLIQPTIFSSHQNRELQQDRSRSLNANYAQQIPSSNVNANKNAYKSDNVNADKRIYQRSVQSSLYVDKSIDNSLYVHHNGEESTRSSRLSSYVDSSLKRSHDHPSRSQSSNATKYDKKPLNQNTKQPVKSSDLIYNKNDKRSISTNPSSRFGPNNDKFSANIAKEKNDSAYETITPTKLPHNLSSTSKYYGKKRINEWIVTSLDQSPPDFNTKGKRNVGKPIYNYKSPVRPIIKPTNIYQTPPKLIYRRTLPNHQKLYNRKPNLIRSSPNIITHIDRTNPKEPKYTYTDKRLGPNVILGCIDTSLPEYKKKMKDEEHLEYPSLILNQKLRDQYRKSEAVRQLKFKSYKNSRKEFAIKDPNHLKPGIIPTIHQIINNPRPGLIRTSQHITTHIDRSDPTAFSYTYVDERGRIIGYKKANWSEYDKNASINYSTMAICPSSESDFSDCTISETPDKQTREQWKINKNASINYSTIAICPSSESDLSDCTIPETPDKQTREQRKLNKKSANANIRYRAKSPSRNSDSGSVIPCSPPTPKLTRLSQIRALNTFKREQKLFSQRDRSRCDSRTPEPGDPRYNLSIPYYQGNY